MADDKTRQLIEEALALRASHPQATALEVLDLVMRGKGGWDLDFEAQGRAYADYLDPPSEFSMVLRDAFAPDLPEDQFWKKDIWTETMPDGRLLGDVWQDRVIQPFADRFSLWGASP